MRKSPKQLEALRLVADGGFYPVLVKEDDGWHARWRAIGVDNDWVDEIVRSSVMSRLTEDAENDHHETLHDAWMMALKSRTGLVVWGSEECEEFAKELEEWGGNADEDKASRTALEFNFIAKANELSIECAVPTSRPALKALGQAVFVYDLLRGLRRKEGNANMLVLGLSHTEAELFIKRYARELVATGYTVKGVNLSAKVTAEVIAEDQTEVPKKYKVEIKVAGERVSAAEIRFLLDQGSSLVYFRDHWIEVDRGILKTALRAIEKGLGKNVNPITFALGIGHIDEIEVEKLKASGYLRGLVNRLRLRGDKFPEGEVGPKFVGKLRDYQKRGVAWLSFLTENGFGALLADDMGLGKTIQTIGFVTHEIEKHPHFKTLIISPLTLLANWRHEFAQFAPSLRVYVHHGDNRHLESGFRLAVKENEIILTSYNLLVRDYRLFSEINWDAIVVDEAQTIKNRDTRSAQALCALMPPRRIALTGTPIENSLADIWSLENFLNPGFLGSFADFRERFVKPTLLNPSATQMRRLRHALEPFILRRLKSDTNIAAELGQKYETREYCVLTAKARDEYEAALAEFRNLEHSRGEIFALITKLKLICDGVGKLERLVELLLSIFERGESALIFTQYTKVGEWLAEELLKRFGRRFPFLHGELSLNEREKAIHEFNARKVNAFILSLRAGGFGLNLTKATHVIHFDRWWNPAVENQATDRAHRIGQKRNVLVHLMITEGTIEEHVDEILRRKLDISSSVITEAEWLEAAKLDE